MLLLTIPLEFTKQYFPNQIFEVGRLVMVVVIVTLLAGAFLGRPVRVPSLRLWLPPAIFIGYAGISAIVIGSPTGLRTFGAALTYGLVGIAIYNWTRNVEWQNRVWMWLAVSCIALAAITIFQRVTDTYIWNPPSQGSIARFNATFADPNVLGRVLACMIVCGVALAPAVGNRRAKAIMAVATVLSAAALPLTQSRQAWVIGAVVVVLAVVTSHRRREAAALTAVTLAVFLGVVFLVPEAQNRFAVLQQNLTGGPTHFFERPGLAFLNYLPLDSERHYLIAAGLQMFYDHPIFGLGFGGFPRAMAGAYHGFTISGYTTVDSHTTLVTILAEMGLVGFALAAWWMFEYVRHSIVSIRRDGAHRAYVIAPLLAVIVIFLESQLNARLIDEPYLWVFLGLAWAAMAAEAPAAERATHEAATTTTAATSQNSTARSFFQ